MADRQTPKGLHWQIPMKMQERLLLQCLVPLPPLVAHLNFASCPRMKCKMSFAINKSYDTKSQSWKLMLEPNVWNTHTSGWASCKIVLMQSFVTTTISQMNCKGPMWGVWMLTSEEHIFTKLHVKISKIQISDTLHGRTESESPGGRSLQYEHYTWKRQSVCNNVYLTRPGPKSRRIEIALFRLDETCKVQVRWTRNRSLHEIWKLT